MRTCLICDSPMSLAKEFTSKKAKRSKRMFQVRRFTCTFCDYEELVTGRNGGYEKHTEQQAVNAAQKLYYYN